MSSPILESTENKNIKTTNKTTHKQTYIHTHVHTKIHTNTGGYLKGGVVLYTPIHI